MSQPTVIYWPPSTGLGFQDAIMKSQVLVPAGSNVPLETNDPDNVYKFNKVIRSIDITSTDNLTAVNFIISGIGTEVDGEGNPTHILMPITEPPLQGPNGTIGDIAHSANIYSQINSITVTGANATNFSIGFGESGITDYVFFDYNRSVTPISSASLQFVDQMTMTAAVYGSLNRPESPNISQGGILEPFGIPGVSFIPAFPIIPPLTSTKTNVPILGPVSVVWANIQTTSTDSLYFTFLQAGIS